MYRQIEFKDKFSDLFRFKCRVGFTRTQSLFLCFDYFPLYFCSIQIQVHQQLLVRKQIY
jgi:hypothetical protein